MSIDLTKYDFADFGCSAGGAMAFALEHWGAENGIGIDISSEKVEQTRALGYNAEIADLTQPMSFSGKVDFTILSHLLEHIPSAGQAGEIIRTAALISSRYVFVRQPWFDSDGELARMGLKLYWSDWPGGHTNHMTSLQLYLVLKALRDEGLVKAFSIWGNDRIASSDHSAIIPLDSAPLRHHYDKETDLPKLTVDLSFDCFKEVMAYATASDDIDVTQIPKPFENAVMLLKCGC